MGRKKKSLKSVESKKREGESRPSTSCALTSKRNPPRALATKLKPVFSILNSSPMARTMAFASSNSSQDNSSALVRVEERREEKGKIKNNKNNKK